MARRDQNIWFPRELIQSKALAALRTPTALRVLMIFYTKRQWAKIGRKGKEDWHIKNNGKITFTYKEAKQKYGIPTSTFRTALDELIDKGFLDIAATGRGACRLTNLYTISSRWQGYGTLEYEKPKPRHRKPINAGFRKGNRYGRNCRVEKNSTVMDNTNATVVDNTKDRQRDSAYVSSPT